MAAVGNSEHWCAGVVLTSSVATALPVHGGVDALVEMDVSFDPVNGGVPVEDQAANSSRPLITFNRNQFRF